MKINKKKLLSAIFLLLAVSVVLLLAFMRKEPKKEPYSIIFISKIIDDSDFWTQLIDGTKAAAQEYGVELSVRAPEAEDDYEMQNILIEQAISEHPDAIVLTPASYTETTPLARKIVDSGIRLLLLDSEINEDVEECIISTDNIKAGQLQGSYVRENGKKACGKGWERSRGKLRMWFSVIRTMTRPISLCWASWKSIRM